MKDWEFHKVECGKHLESVNAIISRIFRLLQEPAKRSSFQSLCSHVEKMNSELLADVRRQFPQFLSRVDNWKPMEELGETELVKSVCRYFCNASYILDDSLERIGIGIYIKGSNGNS